MSRVYTENVTADGNYPSADGFTWMGKGLGYGTAGASGTFGSGTVTLQKKHASDWVAVGDNTTLTAAGDGNFQMQPGGIKLRFNVAGSSGADIDLYVNDEDPDAS